MSKTSVGTKLRRHRGLAAIEAALVFPVLLLVTFATIEYGWLFLKQQQIVNVARQAARLGATPDSTNGQVTSQISTMMSSAGLSSSGYTTNTINVVGTGTPKVVTITISIPYNNVALTKMSLVPVPTTISASVAMEKESP